MLVKVYGAAVQGVDATIVTIEVNTSRGIKFFLVGLPDAAVKESSERIRAALLNTGYKFPRNQITVNMAPADIRKEGSAYDLPIAIGILAAGDVVTTEKLSRYLIMGELGLDGNLLPSRRESWVMRASFFPIRMPAKQLWSTILTCMVWTTSCR